MRREWLVCVLLVALTLGVYWPVRNYDFIYYDDPQFIKENPQINAGLTWPGIIYAFTQPVVGNWHPVTVLSHMLDCELFGADAGAHHLVNVVLHTLNALLLFFLLRGLTGATWRSAIVAAIFALHPLRVESVAWIAERKDVLSGLFFLLTLLAWAEAQRTAGGAGQGAKVGCREQHGGGPVPSRPGVSAPSRPELFAFQHLNFSRRTWHLAALLFYAFGLMSKPMLVTLPFVLLLLDVWPLCRLQGANLKAWWPLIREKLPLFALSLICSVITLLVQERAGAMTFFQQLTFGERLANAVESYVRYLGKLIWPTKLAVVYPHAGRGYLLNDAWPWWQVVAGALLLALLSVWCVRRWARQPYLAVGWFWFLGTLMPVIGLVQVGEQAMANRYTYIPLIGPVICLVWGFWNLGCSNSAWPSGRGGPGGPASWPAGTKSGSKYASASRWATAFAAAAVLSVATLASLTRVQVSHWRNTVSLFDYAIAVTPDNPSAWFAVGSSLEKEGQTSQALVQYRVALAIDPHYSKANYNMGQIFSKAGDIRSAASHFEAALRSNPNDLGSRLNFAHCLQRLGRVREAIAHYEESLRRDPASSEALNNLAWLLATDPDPQIRNGQRAVALAERAVALTESKLPVMIGTLAAAYAEAGRFPDAIAAANKAAVTADLLSRPDLAARNRELMELYQSGRPYHESRTTVSPP